MKSIASKVASATRRYQWLLITLLVLGGVFLYYFTVVLTQNELRIKERSFRGLALMARNIEQEINMTLEKNAQNFLNDLKKYKHDPVKRKEIEKNYNLHISSKKEIPDTNELAPSQIFINMVGSERRLNFEIKAGEEKDTLYAEAHSFIEPLLRTDIFSRYLLMKDSFIIYNNIEGAFDPGLEDSLKKIEALESEQVLKVNLEGRVYRMFNFPFTVQNSKWWLTGMIPADDYRKEKMQLSSNVIVSLVSIFFLCLLLFPFLKCFLMNKEEHLNSGDIVFAFFSFYLIAATLTIAAWNIYTYHALFRNGRDYQLRILAEKIDTSINKEINLAIRQLEIANESFNSIPSDFYDLNIKEGTAIPDSPKNASKRSGFRNIITYPPTENIVWIDSDSGIQKFRWTTFKYIPEKISVQNRAYFKNVIKNDLWKNDSGKTFYLDAVKSWLANDVISVISMKGNTLIKNKDTLTDPVTILSAKLKSVFDPILPQDFGFAIIDEQGKVYFHSNLEYDLHEDFIRETGNSALLKSLLDTRMGEVFTAYYYGTRSRFYIKPLKKMPLFVVTFSDMSKLAEHNISLLSASSVFIFIQAFLIFLSAILIQVFRSQNRIGIKKHGLNWLPPKKIHEDAYLQHIGLYLSMIFLEIFLIHPYNTWFTNRPDGSLFAPGILLTYSILSVGFSYYLIRKSADKNDPSPDSPNKKDKEKQARQWSMAGILTLYLIVLFLFSVNLWRQDPWLALNFIVLQALPFLIFWIINWPSTQALARKLVKKTENSWKTTYIIAIMSFIILNSIVAVSKMYQLCYNQETILMTKAQQLNLAKNIWRKNDNLFLKEDSSIGCYYKNIVADLVKYSGSPDKFEVDTEDTISTNFAWLYRSIRPAYKDFSKGLKAYTSAHSKDSVYQWQVEKKTIRLFVTNSKTALDHNHLNQLFIVSPNSSLCLPGGNSLLASGKTHNSFKIVFYLCFLFILAGLTFLIWRYIKHVFLLYKPKEILNNVPHLLGKLLSEKAEKDQKLESHHIMIVGVPDCGKVKTVREILEEWKIKSEKNTKENQSSEIMIDFRELTMTAPDKLEEAIKTIGNEINELKKKQRPNSEYKYYVLVRNFEYCFHDAAITDKKLNALEELLRQKDWNIILFSTTQTIPFIEDYFEKIKTEQDNTNGEKNRESGDNSTKLQAPEIVVERWINVMSKFSVCYYQWYSQKEIGEHLTSEQINKKDIINNLRKEIKYMHGTTDQGNENQILPKADEKNDDQIVQQEKVDLINSQAASFYFDSIWMSLSPSEKRVLYDFAKDELVNHNNLDDLSVLHKKGLFIYVEDENHFKLASHSFQYYILNRLKRDEITKLEDDQSEKGNWNKLRNMLVVTIILVGAFIFITQQEALNSLITYLSAFTGGLFTLLNVINKIPGGPK